MRVARQSGHPKIATEEIVVQIFCRAGMEDNGTYWPMFGGYRATVLATTFSEIRNNAGRRLARLGPSSVRPHRGIDPNQFVRQQLRLTDSVERVSCGQETGIPLDHTPGGLT
jgi:hypothetical protein